MLKKSLIGKRWTKRIAYEQKAIKNKKNLFCASCAITIIHYLFITYFYIIAYFNSIFRFLLGVYEVFQFVRFTSETIE
ncbi:hypothetical protein BpHYR1_035306 [Brachionus plicatilis]|uniref:Uncharacterized protein n=1 Tax=Brachionus plicatilis TaxID=10195 RepID=A0A3M7QNH6_BRAPC|nr:hypothetical protein BpHYR1_035306 [Brachionus plicatilis]